MTVDASTLRERPRCATCRHWEPQQHLDKLYDAPMGQCVIRAPGPLWQRRHEDQSFVVTSAWPVVPATSRCGEHQPDPFLPTEGAAP